MKTSIPSTLVCLDDSTLFVGSHFADSVMLSLTPTLYPKETIITNLAPISDFLVLPPSHPQAGALITCSGGFGQGTLRVVRQGVGVEDYAAVDFEGIRGIWTMSTNIGGMEIDAPPRDSVLVLGLIERTVFLEMDDDGGLEAVESANGLISNEETIALKEIGGRIVQVTTEQIHIVSQGTKVAGLQGKISACQISDDQVVISSGRRLSLLSLRCQVIQQWTLSEEITCLDIRGDLIVVGLWNSSVQFIVPSTNKITELDIPLSAPARSIILSDILPTLTLLIGSRDGVLTSYSLPTPTTPKDKKTVSLGTQPLRLFSISTPTQNLVFASSDRPTLVHAPSKRDGSKKLVLSALSLRDVLSLTPLNHPAYPDALVIATKEGFRIGKMDEMARLQVRSVGMPNGELPRRITRLDASDLSAIMSDNQTAAGLVGVISLRVSIDINGSEMTEGYLRVWDEDSWQCTPTRKKLMKASK
jgi:DNA damage-binding protein 1